MTPKQKLWGEVLGEVRGLVEAGDIHKALKRLRGVVQVLEREEAVKAGAEVGKQVREAREARERKRVEDALPCCAIWPHSGPCGRPGWDER